MIALVFMVAGVSGCVMARMHNVACVLMSSGLWVSGGFPKSCSNFFRSVGVMASMRLMRASGGIAGGCMGAAARGA